MTDARLVVVDRLDELRRLVDSASPGEQLRPLGLREVVSGPGALEELPAVVARLVPDRTDDGSTGSAGWAGPSVVAVLSDDVPKVCGDGDALDVVTGVLSRARTVRRVVLTGRSGQSEVHADEVTVDQAVDVVASVAPALLVTVGSGTMADIGKVVAQRLDLAHVVVPTAASVNGFADDQSVLLRHGTKRTTPSRWPDALVVDTDVLAGSPASMARSGLGDLLSTYTAAADWRLAALVGFDPSYSPTAVAILRTGVERAVAAAEGLRDNDSDALAALASALTAGGAAMGVAGRTSPSSGAEHTVSHLLEMRAHATHGRAAAHGAQVGAATVVMSRAWALMRERLSSGRLRVLALDEGAMRARVDAAFLPLDPSGDVAAECWAAYERKLSWVNDHRPDLQAVCDGWARHDDEVAGLLAEPSTVAGALEAAGAPVKLSALESAPSAEVVQWAVASCHLMRDRFTIVDLAEVTGCWTDADVAAVLR